MGGGREGKEGRKEGRKEGVLVYAKVLLIMNQYYVYKGYLSKLSLLPVSISISLLPVCLNDLLSVCLSYLFVTCLYLNYLFSHLSVSIMLKSSIKTHLS